MENQEYGIEIEYIKEIIMLCPITKVPHTQDFLKGIINLRGEIIPVIDVRERFKKPKKDYDDLTCIIVIEYNDFTMGLIVDKVREVIFIDKKDLIPPPSENLSYFNQFIKNIGKLSNNLNFIFRFRSFAFKKLKNV